jgi:hypothetical protein
MLETVLQQSLQLLWHSLVVLMDSANSSGGIFLSIADILWHVFLGAFFLTGRLQIVEVRVSARLHLCPSWLASF